MTRRIALIGTAGRGQETMTKELWQAMVTDAKSRIHPGDELFSGGAAWADHLAVALFLEEHVSSLGLFLPAPMDVRGAFIGPDKGAAQASNYYHRKFSEVLGLNTRGQILLAETKGAFVSAEPVGPGFGAFFARNQKVADRVTHCLAYTWGEGDEPADGGTKWTWDRIEGERIHVSLKGLIK